MSVMIVTVIVIIQIFMNKSKIQKYNIHLFSALSFLYSRLHSLDGSMNLCMMQNVLTGTRHLKQVQTLAGMSWVSGERIQDKVGKRVKSILVFTCVKGDLSFTQMLFGSRVELQNAITKLLKGDKG